MRLRDIHLSGPITEAIEKSDFYDFYNLLGAYQERDRQYGDPERSREVERRLHYEARYIFRDQLDQLFRIIANRLYEDDPDPSHGEAFTLRPFYEQWGIRIAPSQYDPSRTQPDRQSLLQLPLQQRGEFLLALNRHRQQVGTKQWFTNTDGTWSKLAALYPELARTGSDLRSLIRGIDRIYGLCHHGGLLADYMDERSWLEDALHTRSIASPAQLLRYSSSDVRQLVGGAEAGSPRPEVTALQKLRLALDKVLGQSGEAILQGEQIELWCRLAVWYQHYTLMGQDGQTPTPGKMVQVTTGRRPGGVFAGPDQPDPDDRLRRYNQLVAQPLLRGTVRLEPNSRPNSKDRYQLVLELEPAQPGEPPYRDVSAIYDGHLHRPSQIADKIMMLLRSAAQLRVRQQ